MLDNVSIHVGLHVAFHGDREESIARRHGARDGDYTLELELLDDLKYRGDQDAKDGVVAGRLEFIKPSLLSSARLSLSLRLKGGQGCDHRATRRRAERRGAKATSLPETRAAGHLP